MTPQQIQQQRQTLLELRKELEDDETEMMSTLGLIRGPKSTAVDGKGKKANEKDPLSAKENDVIISFLIWKNLILLHLLRYIAIPLIYFHTRVKRLRIK